MVSTSIIVILAVLLIIGVVRSIKEKAQTEQVNDSPVQEQEEVYQISQEADQSNYQEVYASEVIQSEVAVEKTPVTKEKKTPVTKKTSTKKESSPKKAAPKKTSTKKTPTKKSTK